MAPCPGALGNMDPSLIVMHAMGSFTRVGLICECRWVGGGHVKAIHLLFNHVLRYVYVCVKLVMDPQLPDLPSFCFQMCRVFVFRFAEFAIQICRVCYSDLPSLLLRSAEFALRSADFFVVDECIAFWHP